VTNHVFYGFTDWADVAVNFSADIGPLPEAAYALYVLPSYAGDATIVFKRDGAWWLASGGHCSCYGLEDQWSPEPFDPVAHLEAKKQGKVIAQMEDYEHDHPAATQDAFDAWLSEQL
jgi:hypothetical protein